MIIFSLVVAGFSALWAAQPPTAVPPPAAKPPVAAPAAPAPAVAVSSAAKPAEITVGDLYKGDHIRDPFADAGSVRAAVTSSADLDKINIHALVLKGLLRDKRGDVAVVFDQGTGASYVLRHGKLYDIRNKVVPHVTGVIKPKQKTVHLMTQDKDVQTLVLGEEEGL